MPTNHRYRNLLPPLYALLVVVGFLIDAKVGVGVAVVGAIVLGLLWTMLAGPSGKPGEPGYVPGRQRNRNRNR
jgi:hypothetical protein